jgi:excisionase family DNA binding protein
VSRLLTADEVAERLGVTTGWVWAQARAGRIPHVPLGRYRRFREEAIDAWVRSLEQTDPPSSSSGSSADR